MAARWRAGTQLRACTLNLGGLHGNPEKFAAVLTWAAGAQFQIFFLQECSTGAASPFEFASAKLQADLIWRGWTFYAPGSPTSRGCMVLIKPTPFMGEPQQVQVPGGDGRLLRVDVDLAGRPASLVCVYAPAEPGQRAAFFSPQGALASCLPAQGERLVVLGGDLNCCVAAEDYVGRDPARGARRAAEAGAVQLRALMADRGLRDVWRHQHGPAARDATHLSAAHHTGARLDRWLVSQEVLGWAAASVTSPARPVATDHFPVALSLTPPPPVFLGKGRRSVSSLAYDWPELRQRVEERLQRAAERLAQGPGPAAGTWACRDLWAGVKADVLQLTQDAERARREEDLAKEAVWAAAAAAAKHGFLAAPAAAAAGQWERAAGAPVAEFRDRGRKRVAVGAVLDHHYSFSQGTFYAYEKAAPPRVPRFVRQLKVQGGQATVDLTTAGGTLAALQEFEQHFSAATPRGLFAARAPDVAARRQLLGSMQARLSPEQADAAEGPGGASPLGAEELTAALGKMARGKAPGADGLTVEFYVQFWPLLAPLLEAALAEAFADQRPAPAREPLADFLTAVFTMVHKTGKPEDEVTGYRPIALLNVDTRIAARALADRLQVPLGDVLIDTMQSAFLAHRDISDNLLYHMGVAQYVKLRARLLWELLLDFASAYDKVDWGLLGDTMRHMGFKTTGHVRWAQLLHRGATGFIALNRHLHGPFPIHSGLMQGSGASPLYWCISLQPFSSYLSSLSAGGRMLTPLLPLAATAQGPVEVGPAPPGTYHADDTTVTLGRLADEGAVHEACQLYERAGGPATSIPKSVRLPVGVGAEQAAAAPAPVGAMRVADMGAPVRFLGVPLAPHLPQAAIQMAAYGHQPRAISAAAARWRPLVLSLQARVHVAMQCLASKVIYQLGFTWPSAAQLQHMQRAVRVYAALEPHPFERTPHLSLYPGQLTCALPKHEGGLGYPVLSTFAVAMHAKAVAQLVGPAARAWQPLTRVLLADPLLGVESWVITDPTAVRLGPGLPAELQARVNAFAQLRVERIVAPAAQSFWSVMVEPLFYNPVVDGALLRLHQHPAGGLGALPLPQPARAWRRVGDLWAYLHGGQPPPQRRAAMARAVATFRAALPQEWRRHLDTFPAPAADWEVAALPPGFHPGSKQVVRGAAHGAQQQTYWVLNPGNLRALSDGEAAVGLPPQLQWQPAAVVGVRRPWAKLTVEERNAQELPAALRPPRPCDFWLLGPWASVWLDPTVHGWRVGQRAVPLHEFSVREARLRLTHQAYAAEHPYQPQMGAAYEPGSGAWPRVWGRRPAARAAAQGRPDWDDTGVTQLEAGWAAAFAARQAAEAQQEAEDAGARPAGERDAALAPQYDGSVRHRAPRRSPPEERHAQQLERQQAAQALVPLGPGRGAAGVAGAGVGPGPAPLAPAPAAAAPAAGERCTAVWARLMGNSVHHEGHRMVAWKVLHGVLAVGGFKVYTNSSLPARSGCCAACLAAGRGPQLETLTHAFMDCPDVAPALDWLLAVVGHLAGQRPPRDPLVLLADADWRWQPGQPPQRALWQIFRVAYLGCAWAARLEGRGSAEAIVRSLVAALTIGVQRDWRRATADVLAAAVGIVPTVWFRGRSPQLKLEQFRQRWPALGSWFEVQPGQPEVVVKLSTLWPVPLAPAAGAVVLGPGAAAAGDAGDGHVGGGPGGAAGGAAAAAVRVVPAGDGVGGNGAAAEGADAAAGRGGALGGGGRAVRAGAHEPRPAQLPGAPLPVPWPPLPLSPPPPVPADGDGDGDEVSGVAAGGGAAAAGRGGALDGAWQAAWAPPLPLSPPPPVPADGDGDGGSGVAAGGGAAATGRGGELGGGRRAAGGWAHEPRGDQVAGPPLPVPWPPLPLSPPPPVPADGDGDEGSGVAAGGGAAAAGRGGALDGAWQAAWAPPLPLSPPPPVPADGDGDEGSGAAAEGDDAAAGRGGALGGGGRAERAGAHEPRPAQLPGALLPVPWPPLPLSPPSPVPADGDGDEDEVSGVAAGGGAAATGRGGELGGGRRAAGGWAHKPRGDQVPGPPLPVPWPPLPLSPPPPLPADGDGGGDSGVAEGGDAAVAWQGGALGDQLPGSLLPRMGMG
jgi:exonuclease III